MFAIFRYTVFIGAVITCIVMVAPLLTLDHLKPKAVTLVTSNIPAMLGENKMEDGHSSFPDGGRHDLSRDLKLQTPNMKAAGGHTVQLKKILLWNPFFGEPDYGIGGFGTSAFRRTKCSHTCILTNDRSELDTADAVVIHAYNMGPKFQNITLPKRTNKQQIFVFFILESPLKSYKGFEDTGFSFTDIFNLTFTFLDAPETDIYCPMGGIKGRKRPNPAAVPSIGKVRKKTQLVAWFVSNCKVPSARFSYANRLSRYIPVSIYGACGDLSCPKRDANCFADVAENTLFYLAFENTFCEGYATEKLIRTLRSSMVPIVYGAANYSKLVHPKSFIDVRDYKSPSHLARYLLHLRKYPAKYMEYHRWKKYHHVLQEGDYKALGFCKLCNILNTEGYPYKSGFDPIKDYWNPDKWCVRGPEELDIVHLKHAPGGHSWLRKLSNHLLAILGFNK